MTTAGGSAWLFLQYNKHLSVIGEEVRNSFTDEACCDAKIVCDGGVINVHRLVLASASPWLKTVFEEVAPTSDPLFSVLIPDVKYADMVLLIRFIYGGEVTVPLKQLGTLQDLIQLLQLNPGHANGKFIIENIHDNKTLSIGGTTITPILSTSRGASSSPRHSPRQARNSPNIHSPNILNSVVPTIPDVPDIGPMPLPDVRAVQVTDEVMNGMEGNDDGGEEEGREGSPKPEDLSVANTSGLNPHEIRVKTELSFANLTPVTDMHELEDMEGSITSNINQEALQNTGGGGGGMNEDDLEVDVDGDDDDDGHMEVKASPPPPPPPKLVSEPIRRSNGIGLRIRSSPRQSASNSSAVGERKSERAHRSSSGSTTATSAPPTKRTRSSHTASSSSAAGAATSDTTAADKSNNNQAAILAKVGAKITNTRTKTPHLQIIPESGVLRCSMCHYECSSYDDYKKHEKVHQPNFSCQYCGKGFFIKWNLIAHLRTHTGEKPFTCFFCRGSFRQKAHLIKHISSVHRYQDEKKPGGGAGVVAKTSKSGNSSNVANENSDSNSTEGVSGGKEDYSCCFCGEVFDNKDGIRRHISSLHRDLLTRAQENFVN